MKATLSTRLLLSLVDTAQHIADVVNLRATTDGICAVAVNSTRKCICVVDIAKDAFLAYDCTGVSIGLELDTFRSALRQLGPTLTISMSDARVTFESDDCCVEVHALNHDRQVLNTVRQLSERVYDCVAHVPATTWGRVANMPGAVHVSCRGDTLAFASTGPRCSSNIVLPDHVVKQSDLDVDVATHYLLLVSACSACSACKSVVLSMSPGSIRAECGWEGGHMICYVPD